MQRTPTLFVPDVLERHVEEIGFLWGQRQAALRSPDYTLTDVAALEDWIAAHLDGVRAARERAIPFLEAQLTSDDPLGVFAAAFALLHLRGEAETSRVLDAFTSASGEQLGGLREAMCHSPLNGREPRIDDLFHRAPAPTSAAAGQILAYHAALRPSGDDVRRFCQDADPQVRVWGWQLVGYLGVPVDAKTYAAAMREDEPAVRRAAVEAGAWCGERGIVMLGRKFAATPSADHLDLLEMLAILGGRDDLPLMTAVGNTVELGPVRFRLLGAFGHPALMDVILTGIADLDAATAAAAGAAFTKMTGQDIDSNDRATLPHVIVDEADEFAAEFAEEVVLPDPERARRYWQEMTDWVTHVPRLCRGYDIGRGLDQNAFAALDMEARWEVMLRCRFTGAWKGSPLSLEVFPQLR